MNGQRLMIRLADTHKKYRVNKDRWAILMNSTLVAIATHVVYRQRYLFSVKALSLIRESC